MRKRIKGNVAFLGGLLSYLSELRKRFTETLCLKDQEVIFPEESKYYAAIGASLIGKKSKFFTSLKEIKTKIENIKCISLERTKILNLCLKMMLKEMNLN